jgi:S1-C subfamily serine protease
MRSTFKIAGKHKLGTVFIIGKPFSGDDTKAYFVLATAAHVLNDIKEEQALLFLRKKEGNEFVKFPIQLTIRKKGKPLWTEHSKADVAVMYVKLPTEADIQLLPMSLLATDKQLEEYGVHPGDVLSCLGYPYGAEANEAGFPILRSGQIASYPLTPTNKFKTFLYDFRVFPGNSGGPVYFTGGSRSVRGAFMIGTIQLIMGLVSEEASLEEEIPSLIETRHVKHPLSLARVVHASLIKEVIDSLPQNPE